MLVSMMALLRRSQVMALALVLLTPGVTGSAARWLHPCPAQAAVADHQHHGPAPADTGHSQNCQCIGPCNSATTASPAKPIIVAVALAKPDHHIVPPSGISFVPAGTPSDLLPPATAPPLLS